MLDNITPLILTYNEEPNIGRTLEHLTWAKRIVVIDSFSEDITLEILHKYPQVEVFQRQFDTHTNQWNYGLEQVKTEWVLSLDADYVLPEEMVREIQETLKHKSSEFIDGYFAGFHYCVFGKPLRATILPPRQVLFRKHKSTYVDDGHTQLLQVSGNSGKLKSCINHDDRKSLSRWLWAQDRYMKIESKKLLSLPTEQLSFGDRLRKKKVIAPIVILLYCLILKGGILDGWAGWYYAWQRMLAEILLAIRLIELEREISSK
ncbi:glycosyltransferase family 2 protein [Pseudanabaena sp. FACHB-1998]|uniref:glycosyltransferase family 2 protein n=1 Tax=Pseudanabaena sp. FACHB-1998 TaxID=2692858 RepID=UPI0016804199|nr:glycosyltransferase family 2 protein [Pseudanabaena sp. FACHB-1998]MBD2175909.1 glycosyltransferase family 2 protein [Pseudanabaena sp. FACHB-1998]